MTVCFYFLGNWLKLNWDYSKRVHFNSVIISQRLEKHVSKMISHLVIGSHNHSISYFWKKKTKKKTTMTSSALCRTILVVFACFSPLITNARHECRPFSNEHSFDWFPVVDTLGFYFSTPWKSTCRNLNIRFRTLKIMKSGYRDRVMLMCWIRNSPIVR